MPETTSTLPRLSCFVEVPQDLLDEATVLWHQSLEGGARRENQLSIEIPANWKRAINRHATHVMMNLNAETGMLYGLAEACTSVNGGGVAAACPGIWWCSSCVAGSRRPALRCSPGGRLNPGFSTDRFAQTPS